MRFRTCLVCALACAACGARAPVAPSNEIPVSGPLRGVASPSPDVRIRATKSAEVGGAQVPFDGIDEGLSWPALVKAVGSRTGPVALEVERTVPTMDVLRAVWSLRAFDLVVESPDSAGKMYAIDLPRRKDAASPTGKTCHAAVFARRDGTIRVAAPGGSREVGGERPVDTLVASLAAERDRCTFDYVAFGAESNQAPWSTVFDVMAAVDEARAAGDTRYVLGEAMK